MTGIPLRRAVSTSTRTGSAGSSILRPPLRAPNPTFANDHQRDIGLSKDALTCALEGRRPIECCTHPQTLNHDRNRVTTRSSMAPGNRRGSTSPTALLPPAAPPRPAAVSSASRAASARCCSSSACRAASARRFSSSASRAASACCFSSLRLPCRLGPRAPPQRAAWALDLLLLPTLFRRYPRLAQCLDNPLAEALNRFTDGGRTNIE